MKFAVSSTHQLACVLLASLLIAGCHQGTSSSKGVPGPEYAAIIERLTKEGVPTTPALMQEPMPAESDNAGPIFLKVAAAVHDKSHATEDSILDNSVGLKSMPSEAQYAQIGKALVKRASVMNEIHTAAHKKACAFIKDYSDPGKFRFPELAAIRDSTRRITAESLAMAHAGHAVEAVKNQALVFQMAKHAAHEHTLIGMLVQAACNAIGLSGLQKILYVSHGNAQAAMRIAEVIQVNLGDLDLQAVWKKERGIQIQLLERCRKDGPAGLRAYNDGKHNTQVNISPDKWDEYIDHNGIVLQNRMERVVTASLKPIWQAMAELSKIDTESDKDQDPNDVIAVIALMETNRVLLKIATNNATASLTQLGAELIAYKANHGSYPASLSKIVSPEPIDPNNGKPYGYTREGDGFVVFSTGVNSDFDGGEPGKVKGRFDVLFRYPLPAYYKVGTGSAVTGHTPTPGERK